MSGAEPLRAEAEVPASLADLAVRRRLGERQQAAADEVRRLLDAGVELLRRHPGTSPRVADIVRLAKVSNDAFYRAFRGKEELLAAIVDDGQRRLMSYVRHQRDKSDDPAGQLRRAIEAVMKQASDPAVAATTRAVLRLAPGVSRQAIGFVRLGAQLAELLEDPLRALGAADPGRDARTLALATIGEMEHFLWREEVPGAIDVDHLHRFALRAAPPGRGRRR